MRFVTRAKVRVDRVACPWLIKRFIDPNAELLFVPQDDVIGTSQREGAKMARIVRGADTTDRHLTPESAGLYAIASGFAALSPTHFADDHALLEAEFPMYDALYAYCQQKAAGR